MLCVPIHCRPAGGRADNPLIHRLTAIHAGVRPYGIDGVHPKSVSMFGWLFAPVIGMPLPEFFQRDAVFDHVAEFAGGVDHATATTLLLESEPLVQPLRRLVDRHHLDIALLVAQLLEEIPRDQADRVLRVALATMLLLHMEPVVEHARALVTMMGGDTADQRAVDQRFHLGGELVASRTLLRGALNPCLGGGS